MPYHLKGKKGVERYNSPYRLKNYDDEIVFPLCVWGEGHIRDQQNTSCGMMRLSSPYGGGTHPRSTTCLVCNDGIVSPLWGVTHP
jgi:hypothetical protein